MMTATWVTDEVKKAVEKGYILDKIFEVWHFERISLYDPQTKSGGAFTDYVNTFLKKAKLPVGQNGVKPIMTDINTQRNTTKGKEFVSNTITCIEPRSQSVGKIDAEQFLGVYLVSEKICQKTYIPDPCEYVDMLTSNCQQVKDVSYVSEEMVRLQWI